MKDYLGKMKNLIDTLVASGYPLSEDDQILHVLGGLGLDMILLLFMLLLELILIYQPH